MSVFIALLRGINVGGNKRVGMTDLVKLMISLGFSNVRTYLQSGNAIFNSDDKDPGTLPALIGEEISRKFGFMVKVIVRTPEDLSNVVTHNPFAREGLDPDRLHVTFFSDVPIEPLQEGMINGKNEEDRYVIAGREVYLYCPNGYGKTKFSNAFFEKKLKVVATTRNWKTVNVLADMAEG